ncbi:serine hydrolase [Staphylococcus saprophyticus]|nr:serine hydrolase [Staphylococcus saprophyticus]
MDVFISKMNEVAKNIGMLNSNFKNPSGLTKKGQLSTSYDLSLLLLQASLNPIIVKIWKKEKHIVRILGDNTRKSEIKSTVYNKSLNNYYDILGGKTGTVDFIKNLSVLLYAKDEIYLVTVLKAKGNRFHQVKLIMDTVLDNKENNIDANSFTVFKYPLKNIELLKNFKPHSVFSKNESDKSNPASITKLLTLITALEYPIDLNDKIKIQESDIVEDNMNNIYVGDIISLNDAMHFMLLSSSNILANAVARYIEENYL